MKFMILNYAAEVNRYYVTAAEKLFVNFLRSFSKIGRKKITAAENFYRKIYIKTKKNI